MKGQRNKNHPPNMRQKETILETFSIYNENERHQTYPGKEALAKAW